MVTEIKAAVTSSGFDLRNAGTPPVEGALLMRCETLVLSS